MKFLILFLLAPVGLVYAQAGAPPGGGEWKPETPIATLDGKTVTAGDLQAILRALPAQQQQQALRNSRQFLEQFGMLRRLSGMAEKAGLDKQSPLKEQLDYNRMVGLAQAQLMKTSTEMKVAPEEVQKFYETNRDRYELAKVKVLYIPFVSAQTQKDPKDSKALTEEQAKAKAEKLLADIRAGADFVKLVREHSGDPISAAKDGDFGTIRRSDKLPEPVKNTIFALKPGAVSDPVSQPNGFYLFRLEEKTVEQFDQIKPRIEDEVRQAKFAEWVQTTQKSIGIKIENESFFSAPSPQPVPATAPK